MRIVANPWKLAAAIAALVVVGLAAVPGVRAGDPPVPVLLELFTSEGCDSCPSADQVLLDLIAHPPAGVEIVPLSLHVDYWNRLGWKDPFSSASATRRQQEYADAFAARGVYTPQLVVDGQAEMVGSQRAKVLAAIAAAAKKPKPALALTVKRQGQTLEVAFDAPAGAAGQVMLALTEDGLASNPTRGENRGARLQHSGVVRSLTAVHAFAKPAAAPLLLAPKLEIPAAANAAKCHLVAFIQTEDGRVTHVASAAVPTTP